MQRFLIILISSIILSVSIALILDLDDRLTNWYFEWRLSEKERNTSILLSNYKADLGPYEIGCVQRNLSGITYNADRQTLFAITNSPTVIIELTTSGKCLRQIDLKGFSDTEGIAYLGYDNYAIIEEGRDAISILSISETTEAIHRKAIIRSLQLDVDNPRNKGFEGIAFNPGDDVIYIVSEKTPMRIFKVKGLTRQKEDNRIDISFRKHNTIVVSKLQMEDLSGLHFDPVSNNFLFLSHESKLVAGISSSGKRIGYMELEKDLQV